MKTKIISMINVKGGVGKTLSTINIGGELASQGYKVLLIDNDSQSNMTQMLNVEGKYIMLDLYTNNKVGFDDCIIQVRENIYMITNTIQSSKLEHDLHNRMTRELILKNKLHTLKKEFDFILIDNSPFLGILMQNSLAISTHYIEVIDNSPSALQGLAMARELIDEMKENSIISDLKLLGVLRSRFDKRSNFTKQLNEVVEEAFGEDLFKTIVYDSVKYKEAPLMNKTIQEYSEEHAEVYIDLTKEIIERIE